MCDIAGQCPRTKQKSFSVSMAFSTAAHLSASAHREPSTTGRQGASSAGVFHEAVAPLECQVCRPKLVKLRVNVGALACGNFSSPEALRQQAGGVHLGRVPAQDGVQRALVLAGGGLQTEFQDQESQP